MAPADLEEMVTQQFILPKKGGGEGPDNSHMSTEESLHICHNVVIGPAMLDLVPRQPGDRGEGAYKARHSHQLIQQSSALKVHNCHAAGRAVIVAFACGGALYIKCHEAHGARSVALRWLRAQQGLR